MVIKWTAERDQKLLAAIIAAHQEMKLDYNKIAAAFGEDITYDGIENRLRSVKKQAKVLAEEIASGKRPAQPPLTPRKRKAAAAGLNSNTTPRKAATKNSNGSAGCTPKKRRSVKKEPSDDSEDAVVGGCETPEEPWSAADDDSD